MHLTSDYIYPYRSERVSRCLSAGEQGDTDGSETTRRCSWRRGHGNFRKNPNRFPSHSMVLKLLVEMFATIGLGQWFRYVVGALEIAGAVGVLIPRFSGLAALGLVCLMAGATLTNVLVFGASPLLPLVLLAVGVLVAWGRWPRTRTLFTNREDGRLQ